MNVSKSDLIKALAPHLKSLIKKPEWADFVRTGVFKERPPVDPDWWYIRAASILLKINKLGPVGVSKLRTKYGGRKNNGVAPEHFRKGSGKIIRLILQQLESAGLLKQEKKGLHKGRVLTGRADALIAKAAKAVEKPRQKFVAEIKEHAEHRAEHHAEHRQEVKKEEAKKEEKEDAKPAVKAEEKKEIVKEDKKENLPAETETAEKKVD
ncbi:30S ribosomal protein S19e [Candidatus Woesearchaeota archaeon]|nr:30S ribosomal protein S19e [Candidatus Woesearchaeota archaeon]